MTGTWISFSRIRRSTVSPSIPGMRQSRSTASAGPPLVKCLSAPAPSLKSVTLKPYSARFSPSDSRNSGSSSTGTTCLVGLTGIISSSSQAAIRQHQPLVDHFYLGLRLLVAFQIQGQAYYRMRRRTTTLARLCPKSILGTPPHDARNVRNGSWSCENAVAEAGRARDLRTYGVGRAEEARQVGRGTAAPVAQTAIRIHTRIPAGIPAGAG